MVIITKGFDSGTTSKNVIYLFANKNVKTPSYNPCKSITLQALNCYELLGSNKHFHTVEKLQKVSSFSAADTKWHIIIMIATK